MRERNRDREPGLALRPLDAQDIDQAARASPGLGIPRTEGGDHAGIGRSRRVDPKADLSRFILPPRETPAPLTGGEVQNDHPPHGRES